MSIGIVRTGYNQDYLCKKRPTVKSRLYFRVKKKDDFLQMVLDDLENKFGEILTKLNLINSENVGVNDINILIHIKYYIKAFTFNFTLQ